MKIPRIDYLIFGYRKVTLDEKDFKNALNAFISKKLSLKLTGLSFLVSEKEFKRMKEGVLSPFSYTVTEPLGLFGALQRQFYMI